MAYLYQQIQNVPGLTGSTSYAKQSDYYGKLGLESSYGKYTGSLTQNTQLLNYIGKPNYGLTVPTATPSSAPSPAVAKPASSTDVPDYLKNYQQNYQNIQKELSKPFKTDEQIQQEVEKAITPDSALPEVPNLVDLFKNMREEYGVNDLEQQIGELKAMEDEAYAIWRQRNNYAENQQVRMGVISGRQGEIAKQQQEQLDFLGRQIQRKSDQVQGAYTLISTIMDLTQTDYNNALNRYNTELDQKLKIYQLTQDAKQQQLTNKLTLLDIEYQEVQRQEQLARANLEIYMNLMLDGNLDYKALDANTKLQLDKMAIQAGLGANFMSKIKVNDKIITTTNRTAPDGTEYVDIVQQRSDGSLYTTSVATGKVAITRSGSSSVERNQFGQTQAEYTKSLSSASKILQEVDAGYAYNYDTGKYEKVEDGEADQLLSAQEMNIARNKIIAEVGDRELGMYLFNEAMNNLGYQEWRP